jgi:hypothetical protein
MMSLIGDETSMTKQQRRLLSKQAAQLRALSRQAAENQPRRTPALNARGEVASAKPKYYGRALHLHQTALLEHRVARNFAIKARINAGREEYGNA